MGRGKNSKTKAVMFNLLFEGSKRDSLNDFTLVEESFKKIILKSEFLETSSSQEKNRQLNI